MGAIWTITKREFKDLITSPIAYVALGILTLIGGVHFLLTLENFDMILKRAEMQAQFAQDQDMFSKINLNEMLIGQVVSFAFFLFLFLIPVITAGSIADEKKQGTYELLFTSPIRIADIIIGKLLASYGFFLVIMATHGMFLMVMFLYGNPEIGPVVSAYLGLALFGILILSLGIFASSLTTNYVVAYLISVALGLSLMIVGWASRVASGNLSKFLEQAAIDTHFQSFNKGMITLSGIVYFLTAAIFFLVGTNVSLQSVTRK